MLIQVVELSKEQKEEVEKKLTLLVQTYEKFHEDSTDNDIEDLKAFFEYIILTYGVLLKAVHKKSVIIIVECTSLESLELLWNDYLSGHLNDVAERYLISDKMKKKLNLETNWLKITIERENYLSCRKALIELSSTYSGEFKQNVCKKNLRLRNNVFKYVTCSFPGLRNKLSSNVVFSKRF